MIWKNASSIFLQKYISVCTAWIGVRKVNINKDSCKLNVEYIKQITMCTWLKSQLAIFHLILLLKYIDLKSFRPERSSNGYETLKFLVLVAVSYFRCNFNFEIIKRC